MANLTAVTVELNVQGEREATAALKNFQSEQAKLSTSVLGSARKLESINSRWADADRLLAKGTISTKAHAAAQKQLGRELAALNGMYDTQGRLLTRQATNQLKAAQAAQQASQAAAQYAQRMEQLRLRLDPVYRASQQYKQSLRELIQFQRDGGITMDEYRLRAQQLKEEFGKVSQGGRGARRSMNNLNIGIQQAGFQISDFAVQVQGGTSAFVAFSQQASQLVGILPLVADNIGLSAGKAIALSAGLGVAIPLLTVAANVFFETAMGADKAGDEVETFEDRLKSARREVQGMVDDLEMARKGFQDVFEKTLTEQVATAQDRLDAARAEVEEFQKFQEQGLGVRFTGMTEAQVNASLEAAKERVRLAKIELEVAKQLAEQKRQQERDVTFAEETAELGRQLTLQRAILESGEESARVAGIEAEQRRVAFKTRLLEAELEGERFAALMKQFNELEKINSEIEEIKDSNEALEAGASVLESLWANIRDRISEADAKAKSLADKFGSSPAIQFDPVSGRYLERGKGGRENKAANMGFNLASGSLLDGTSLGRSSGGGDSQEQTAAEYIQSLEREAALRRRLIGLSEEERERAERRFEIQEKVIELEGDISQERIEQLVNEEQRIDRLTELEEKRQEQVKKMESSFDSFFMSVFDDIDSLEDAFHAMLRSLLRDAYQSTISPVSESLSSGLSDFIGGVFGGGGGEFT